MKPANSRTDRLLEDLVWSLALAPTASLTLFYSFVVYTRSHGVLAICQRPGSQGSGDGSLSDRPLEPDGRVSHARRRRPASTAIMAAGTRVPHLRGRSRNLGLSASVRSRGFSEWFFA